MAYSGERLMSCFSVPFDWSQTNVVVVSGDGVNFCGHALLNTGNRGGYYFHVAGIYNHPLYMNEAQYQHYLRQNKKKELQRGRIPIKHPQRAEAKLQEFASKRWAWMVLPNNCSAFVEEVLEAGGANIGNFWNCPSKGMWN
jgi:hypothetical protein